MKVKRISTLLLGSLFAITCMANTYLVPEQMSGRSTKGLYGKVKTAAYSTGETITFNQEGNIVKLKKEGFVTTRSYTTPTRYIADNNSYFTYNIVFTANMRKEVMDNPEKLSDDYIYDNQGRISKIRFGGYSGHNETYFYSDSERHPTKAVILFHDETGERTITSTFQYLDIDAHGNWTKRKVNSTLKDVEYEGDNGEQNKITTETKNFIETCTLTYFEDASTSDKIRSIEVSAPEAIGINDQFRLSFTFQSKPQNVKLAPSNDFEVLMGPATSTSTTIMAGVMTSKFTSTYILTPKRKGKLPLPKLSAQIDGQSINSKLSYINVTENGVANTTNKPKSTTPTKDSLIVKAIVDKESIRKGESVLYTLKIYTLANISSVDKVSLIDFPYCYIEEIEQESTKTYSLEHYQNRNYQTVVYRQFKLTPLQSGQIHIPSIKLYFTSEETANKDDPFEAFFNSNTVEIKRTASSNPITINVIP